ncbi:hypothetical protein [Haloglomus halophilum]|uniref:hypothetical protein n=1 Tax=Haloglomus halophilum TaxID=2962672 RepID=UPI0020C9F81A|nr:hypothetical protein [Haloglomus halophilum]
MAASIARKIAAILFAMAMVGSVAVGPALADDDGDVSVGGDGVNVGGDDGVTVGAGDDGSTNGSTTVSADAGQDGVDADASVSGGDGSGTDGSLDCSLDTSSQEADCEPSGTDGGSMPGLDDAPEAPGTGDAPEAPGTGDAPDAPEAPSLGDGGDGDGGSGESPSPPTTMDEISTPEVPIDAPDLPVNYGENVPFEAFPNFCNPPYGVDDVREANPVDPTDPVPGAVQEQAPDAVPTSPPDTPVGDPLGLVSAPIDQCDVFNPYNPAVNPTSPPDDPSATFDPARTDAGQDGVTLYWLAEGTSDEGAAPGGESMAIVMASQDSSAVVVEPSATNGRTDTGGAVDLRMPGNQPNQGTYVVEAVAFGQGASASVTCDGSECKPKAGGVPSGNAVPAVPAGGGSGGEDPQPGPSADTGQPVTNVGQGGAVIIDDREATLGDGLPSGEHDAIFATDGQRVVAEEDAQASGQGRQANLVTAYDSGQYPGDDDVYVLAKGEGAGVIVGLNCDDYRCSPADNTGVYAGPGSMVFDMIPSPPEPVPSP